MEPVVDRARPFYLALSAASVIAMSFGAGRVLDAQNAAARVTFEENPVAGVTIPTLPDEVEAPAETTTTTAAPVVAAAPVTTAAPTVTTTTAVPNVCRWSAKILRGGFADFSGGAADQLVVTVTKASWAGSNVSYRPNYSAPATTRHVTNSAPRSAVADSAGTAQFLIPIGPESQGGFISLLAREAGVDNGAGQMIPGEICDWHQFKIDYNGPEGLVGGITNSAVGDLTEILDELGLHP